MTKQDEIIIKVKGWLKPWVRLIAFTILIVAAAYGVRQALDTLQDPVRDGLTVIFTFLLAWIVSPE